MKRALIIIGGTVGGLGAVFSITPPRLGVPSNSALSTLAAGTNSLASGERSAISHPAPARLEPATAAPTQTTPSLQSATATAKARPIQTPTATPTSAKTPTATSAPTPTPTAASASTPTPTATPTAPNTPTPVTSGASGTFSGASFDANQEGRIWGRVTVTVTLINGVISHISAVQNPSSLSDNAFATLTPEVVGVMAVKDVMALSPNSLFSQVQGRTGASYTAKAYWESLQSALSKAGL